MRIPLAIACLTLFASAAPAGDAVVGLGSVSVRYDTARWQATPLTGRVSFTPVGQKMRFMDPVELRSIADNYSCAQLADQAFEVGGAYDATELTPVGVTLGGIPAERYAAGTRCRNATPTGVVICAKTGGNSYLLQSLNQGCTGSNLFSGIDPLGEIANGLSFASE